MASPSEGASSSHGFSADVSRVTPIDVDMYAILESFPCFSPGPLGTPHVVDLSRVYLPSGESLAVFDDSIHRIGDRLQPFMDAALGTGPLRKPATNSAFRLQF